MLTRHPAEANLRHEQRAFDAFALAQAIDAAMTIGLGSCLLLAAIAHTYWDGRRLSPLIVACALAAPTLIVLAGAIGRHLPLRFPRANLRHIRIATVLLSTLAHASMGALLVHVLAPAGRAQYVGLASATTLASAPLLYDSYGAFLALCLEIWAPLLQASPDPGALPALELHAATLLVAGFGVSLLVRRIVVAAFRANDQSRAIASDLGVSNKDLKMFFLAANHDLAQPLTAINFGLRSVNELTAANSPAKQHIDLMFSASETLTRLIADIVQFEKVASGLLDAVPSSTPLQDMFDRIIAQTENMARVKNISLWARPTQRIILSGAFIIERIVRNLTENAIKNTHSGGVLLAARRHGDAVSIEIWDTGVGIDPANIARVFDLFYQNKTDTAHPTGHGIGLTIVQTLAEKIGATIIIQSTPGRGTVLKLLLPPGSHASPILPTRPPASPDCSWDGIHIALVEDNTLLRQALCARLVRYGARVTSAANSLALADKLGGTADAVDVLLTDWNLGHETGAAAHARICQLPGYRAHWIVITGDIAPADRALLHQQRVPLLDKPFDPHRLAALIDAVRAGPTGPASGRIPSSL